MIKIGRKFICNYDRVDIYKNLYEQILTANLDTPIRDILQTILAKHPDGDVLTIKMFIESELNSILTTKKEIKDGIEKIKSRH